MAAPSGHLLGTREGTACCRVQTRAGGFVRQTIKGAAPQSVQAMALKTHYWAVRQCPGLASSPPVQSGPPDSATVKGEERCEEAGS